MGLFQSRWKSQKQKNTVIDETQCVGYIVDQTPQNRDLVNWKSLGNNTESSMEILREEM